jgi:hypothetical protein
MDNNLRLRLRAADSAPINDSYSAERQQQITHRITSEAGPALRQPSRRRIVVPLAAAVVVATSIAAAVAVHSGSAPTPTAAAGTQVSPVSQRLDDIAQIAAVHQSVSVGQDQYLYSRIVEAGSELTRGADGTYTAGPLPALKTHDNWSPEDPTKRRQGDHRDQHA